MKIQSKYQKTVEGDSGSSVASRMANGWLADWLGETSFYIFAHKLLFNNIGSNQKYVKTNLIIQPITDLASGQILNSLLVARFAQADAANHQSGKRETRQRMGRKYENVK